MWFCVDLTFKYCFLQLRYIYIDEIEDIFTLTAKCDIYAGDTAENQLDTIMFKLYFSNKIEISRLFFSLF